MYLGWGAVNVMSKRQKLNPRSLTEAELIRVDGVLQKLLWLGYCIEVQEFEVSGGVHVSRQTDHYATLE